MKPLYVFTHIPKCGGTSVGEALCRIFGWDRAFDLNAAHDAYESFAGGTLDLSEYDCIFGHFVHGSVERNLPSGRPTIYLGLVREPLERFISFFDYLRAQQSYGEGHLTAAIALAAQSGNVEAFYDALLAAGDPQGLTGNTQSVYVHGAAGADVGDILHAVDHKYHLLLPLQHIEDFFARLTADLGKRPVAVPQENESRRFTDISRISPPFLHRFRLGTGLDQLLYNYVLAKSLQQKLDAVAAKQVARPGRRFWFSRGTGR